MAEAPAASRWPGRAILLALTASLLLFRLGAAPLVGPDEPRYARVAVEMRRTGDIVTPTLQGQPWLEKPALYYWLAAGAFSLLGETEAAARLPSVTAGVLFVAATAFTGSRLYGASAGLHAGFVLGTAVLTFAYGRAAAMDMLLAAAVTAALGLLALAVLGRGGAWTVPGAYAFMGVATLAKGPIGFLLPVLVTGGYVLAARDRSALRRALSPLGALVFLLIAAPWYILVYLAQGQAFIDVFLLDHNLARFTSTIHRHPGPPYYYLPILVGGLFPWSGLLLPAFGAVRPRRSRSDLFVLLWFALPFAFFSAAGSKLPGYVLPCLPPLALLMGRAADEMIRGSAFPPGSGRRAAGLLSAVTAAAVALLLLRLGAGGGYSAHPVAVWALLLALLSSRRLASNPAGALGVLRVGSAGFLVLLALAAPPVLARRESGRDLFLPAQGREVLAWGAWRSAWMAGYFYNDGKVREIAGLSEVMDAAREGPVLALCGPAERQLLARTPSLETQVLAEGPRGNALVRARLR